jgi:hypothetical protein
VAGPLRSGPASFAGGPAKGAYGSSEIGFNSSTPVEGRPIGEAVKERGRPGTAPLFERAASRPRESSSATELLRLGLTAQRRLGRPVDGLLRGEAGKVRPLL